MLKLYFFDSKGEICLSDFTEQRLICAPAKKTTNLYYTYHRRVLLPVSCILPAGS